MANVTNGTANGTAAASCAQILATLYSVDVMPVDDAEERDDAALRTAMGVAAVLASLTLLVFGHRILRTVSAVANGSVVFFLALRSASWVSACELQIAVAGLSAASAALLTVCLLKTGLFLVGASAFGLTTYVLYDGMVSAEPSVLGGMAWMGRSVVFWGLVAASAVAGAVVVVVLRRKVYMAISSLLGATGMCVSLVLFAPSAPAWVFLVVFCVSTAGGIGAQHLLRRSTSSAAEDDEVVSRRLRLRRRRASPPKRPAAAAAV